MPRRILFLCTGNYYRSRFAEELFNHHARSRGLDWIADSRGLALERGIFNIGPISRFAEDGLAARGVSLPASLRSPVAVLESDLRGADRVIALKETEHRPLMQERFSNWCSRIEYWDIHDLDQSSAAEALAEIEGRILQMLESLLKSE